MKSNEVMSKPAIAPDKAGLHFFALPDDRTLQVRFNSAGSAEFMRHNMLSLPNSVSEYLSVNANTYWYPQPNAINPPPPQWIVNNCTDPDSFAKAMKWLNETYGDHVPIFNHPKALSATARDRQVEQFDGISGLTVPHCVRFTYETAQDLARVFDENGFRFPVLVRPNEMQTGRGLKRIDSHEDWDKLLYNQWFRKDHMMIQFEDSRTDEGIYLKARVVFIGGKPYLRHVKAAAGWMVHNIVAQPVAGFPRREMEIVDMLEADSLFMAICEEIGSRIGLDLFGADIGVDTANQRFVLFETNPSMSIFFPKSDNFTSEELARHERLVERTSSYLEAYIQDPTCWINQCR